MCGKEKGFGKLYVYLESRARKLESGEVWVQNCGWLEEELRGLWVSKEEL